MAIQKRPYELSVWIEKLNGNNSKIEEKGVIIGAHDMSYPGRATDIVLRREVKGTNTLTFQMPDRYFDSLTGEYVRNDFIDMMYPEVKLKLFYKNRWYEFFIKKVDEKKQLKSYIKSFTCSDASIDELSRNGYGITYDTELNNNVEEIGVFTEETLEDSIWQYHPENNWGDFTEFKEEKLYRIPISCFGGSINGYKLNFELENGQREDIKKRTGTDVITNLYTNEIRPVELSDDLARGSFWDEYVEDDSPRNSLTKDYHVDIPNDGYIYVPYSCLSFCYGTPYEPDFSETIRYDRAATETAIDINKKLILSPPSVDPRGIIQFYAIPSTAELELDEDGVILNKEYVYFMTLTEWNRAVQLDRDWWYIFEDTRLCQAEVLGSADIAAPSISHTFKYLKDGQGQILGTDYEYRGNKCVFYDGYLSDVNNNTIVKGKKFSITDRTEVNISEDIDQYTTIYNSHADEFVNEYSSEDWDYRTENRTAEGKQYRVCSKLETRQIIPQLARNLVQNGSDMDSIDGWSPMSYLLENSIFITPNVVLRGVSKPDQQDISTSSIVYTPAVARVAQICQIKLKDGTTPSATNPSQSQLDEMYFNYNKTNYYWGGRQPDIEWCDMKDRVENWIINPLRASGGTINIYAIGLNYYIMDAEHNFQFLFEKGDEVYTGVTRKLLKIEPTTQYYNAPIDPNTGEVRYVINKGEWAYQYSNGNMINVINKEAEVKTGYISDNNGQEIANFGIIGQNKIIEKDKIYCLGISAWATKDFHIKIGKGSLVSDGEYTLNGDVLDFGVGMNQDIDIEIYNTMPTNFYEEKKNLEIETLPTSKFILFKAKKSIENPYIVISSENTIILFKLYLFEAYTKGVDAFPNTNNKLIYRYSGRDLFWPPKKLQIEDRGNYEKITESLTELAMKEMIIFEDDIMLGSTYGYEHYFIQRLKANSKTDNEFIYCDTMGEKEFITSNPKLIQKNSLPLDAAKYTLDDCEIQTNYIDLNKCKYYDQMAALDELDCKCGNGHTCFYQKFGYCPFRFKTEKHDRRIRTMTVSKSNRFNIIQETSKVFEVYPQFYIDHKSNGAVVKDENGDYIKKVFFITEKGRENKVGFRYEKNLKNISRNVVSDQIVTKLYVLDVDSEISKTGLCSIKTAEDNPSKDSYIIDLSYYIEKGMLDKEEVEQDLYGITPSDIPLKNNYDIIPPGFLKQLGYYNTEYDKLSNKIINLQDSSFTELEANLTVNYQGIITAQEQILKIKKQIDKYKNMYTEASQYETQQVYLNYLVKLSEQQSILTQLIYNTFFTDGICDTDAFDLTKGYADSVPAANATAIEFFDCIKDLEESKKYWIDQHSYTKGILGQFNSEYLQIQQWKRERASYLKLINQISSAFYKKYEPYLKEGTWSDSNYLTDNAYYFGALDVAADGAVPKVTYTIDVIDISPLSEEYDEVYDFDLADVTYVEDIGMFGINKHTGLPNRLRTLISNIEENLDDPSKNKITVQNYTTSFQDIFQQVTASVQSLTYNENIYKRSSNFTSMQAISNDSLQGALDTNDLTLINTEENNIQVDNTGTSGSDINNHANKYRLDGQGLFFSNDGGQHWSVGVGPSGINADYIKVGTLDAGKIRIADSSYVYFSWDKDGIVAYRDPQAVTTDSKNLNDAAIFNKYGLSIVSNGNIKLRAGYSFNNESGGEMTGERDLGDEIGFYLYNNNGEPIFSTTSSASGKRESAIIKLIGEMMVSNTLTVQKSGGNSYSNKLKPLTPAKFVYSPYLFEIPSTWVTTVIETNPDTHETIHYFDGTSIPISNSILAAYFIGNENLTEVMIEREGMVEIYTKTSVNETSIVSTYCDTTNESIRYKINKRHQVAINHLGGKTHYYYEISDINGNNSKKYFFNSEGTEYGQTMDITIFNGTESVTPVTGAAAIGVVYNCYDWGNPLTVKQPFNTYTLDGIEYLTMTSGGGGTITQDSSVGLYLNNPSLNGQEATGSGVERLFLCCAQNGDQVANLFAVTKDGSAYFGGRIENENSAINVSDKITIANPLIRIDNDGSLSISFGQIKDPNNGKSLNQYIADQINDAGSDIRRALDNEINDVNNRISSAIGSIESFRDHWHQLNVKGGTAHFSPSAGEPPHDIPYSQLQIVVCTGDTSHCGTVPIGDIYSVGGVC